MSVLPLVLVLFACDGNDPSSDSGDLDSGIDDTSDTNDTNDCSTQTFYEDLDGDGFGTNTTVNACTAPSGYVAKNGDCNDADTAIHPNSDETCDDTDWNCDGDNFKDAVNASTFYADADDDGYGDPNSSKAACSEPAGHVTDSTDCDDSDSSVNPDTVWHADADNDGYGDPDSSTTACEQPSGTTLDDQDCDDSSKSANPDGTEICDGIDNDCDDQVDATLCSDLETTFTGGFQLGAVEGVGNIVVNNMQCTNGSMTLTVDLSADPVVQGDATCSYSGGLGGFSSTQTGTFTGVLAVDGTVTGKYVHDYGSNPSDTYNYSVNLDSDGALSGTGGYRPSSFSAVDWKVTFSSDLSAQ